MKPATAVLTLLVVVGALAAWRGAARPDATDLLGTWRVDLRPTPDAPAYDQAFVVTNVAGDSLQGTFYNTPIEQGRINAAWGAVHFAFTTADRSGTYHHAGRLDAGRLDGSSHSLGRGFVMPWRAERAADQDAR